MTNRAAALLRSAEKARRKLSYKTARLRTITNLGPAGGGMPDIQCDCGLYMYWETEAEPRCPVHGVLYQPMQRKLIDPLQEGGNAKPE